MSVLARNHYHGCMGRGMSKRIELHPLGRGLFAIVDDDQYDYLSQWKWSLRGQYVGRVEYEKDPVTKKRRQKCILMHRVVNKTPDDDLTDHRNGDRLDNRRENLRTATAEQNAWNVGKRDYSTSGYLGVTLDKRKNKWIARIQIRSNKRNLGYFDTAEKAALVVNYHLKDLRGEFCRMNMVPDELMSKEEQNLFIQSYDQNPNIRSGNTSGVRGVSWCKELGMWRAQIQKDRKKHIIGKFYNKMDAAIAYNEKAKGLYGDAAKLNPV